MPNEKPDSFQCGPFEVARNPDVRTFVEKLNRLREAVDSCRVQPGAGYTVNRSSGGTTLSIPGALAARPAPLEHPFRLQVRGKDSGHEFFATKGTVGNGEVKVENQERWEEFKAPARIYLEAKIDELKITALEIKTQDPDLELKRTEIADGRQSHARITLGYFTPTQNGGKDFRVVQNVTTEILTPLFCANGYPALHLAQEYANAYYG